MLVAGAMWLLLESSGQPLASPESTAEYWIRLNYGIAAAKARSVCLADGFQLYFSPIAV